MPRSRPTLPHGRGCVRQYSVRQDSCDWRVFGQIASFSCRAPASFSAPPRIPNAVMIYQAAIDENFPVAEPPTQVARLRSGDPAALTEAVGHYQHRLYRYLLRLVRGAASADRSEERRAGQEW